jgi:HAMP domain-containing protein
MNRKSIRWGLPASYAVIALVGALALGSMMLLVLRKYYAKQELDYLYGNAVALKPILEELIQTKAPQASLQDQVEGLAFLSQTQIKLYDTNGRTIADSGIPGSNQVVAVSGRPPLVGNVTFSTEAERVKDRQARVLIFSAGGDVSKQKISEGGLSVVTGTTDIVVPVSASPYGYGFVQHIETDPAHRSSQKAGVILMTSSGKQLGMLEFSNDPTYGTDVVNSVMSTWLLASIFAIAIAALTGWFMSRRVTSPVLALENATQKMEQGDLSVRVHLQDEKEQEFLSLANSFNGMAEQVEQTVTTLRAFVADAAHELHTPLTALQANLDLARDEKNASIVDATPPPSPAMGWDWPSSRRLLKCMAELCRHKVKERMRVVALPSRCQQEDENGVQSLQTLERETNVWSQRDASQRHSTPHALSNI